MRLRRGTDVQRQEIIFEVGELIYVTDTKDVYVGDGVTAGGILMQEVSVQGTQGSIGVTGSQGTIGAVGLQGTIGTNGLTGAQGASGSGYTGSQGAIGEQGGIGSAGIQGLDGQQGIAGEFAALGYTGSKGEDGTTGVDGYTGSQGATGAGTIGAQGTDGAAASIGYTGSQGTTGTLGYTGSVGATGAGTQGTTGTLGYTGSIGFTGLQGAIGAGTQGTTGTTGTTGLQGAIGAGTQGTAGTIGLRGYTGSGGAQGAIGADSTVAGPQGALGYTGSQGTTGTTGADSTVAGPQGSIGYTGSGGAQGTTGSAVTVSDTAPTSPSDGDLWYNSTSLKMFVYYADGSSSQWVVASPQIPGPAGSFTGTLTQSIIPDTDSAYDLGSATYKFRSLYLSSNTLYLGDSGSISSGAGGEIILPSIKIGTGDNAVKLEADATGKLKTKSIVSGVTQAAEEPGKATVLSDMAGLIALTGMSAGQTALVTSLNKVFMYTGSAWYLIATMTNASPTAITGVNATYALATDGTATTITAVSSDPEGFPLTWSYAVTTGSLTNGGGATATVVQGPGDSTGPDTNVFTITPSTTEAYAGTFSLTFSVTDGATGAVNAVSAFTLAFTPPLPTSGLLALYDMNDTNSYSGSGSTWSDVSGNSGPDLTIDTSVVTYNSSGIGSISSLSLDTNTSTPAVTSTSGNGGLTNSASPYSSTVIMIFSPSSNTPTWGYMFASAYSQGVALKFETSSSSALQTGTAFSGSWQHNAARPTSKFYIDKVDETSMTQQEFKDFLRNTNNQNKYHSFVLTDGHFLYGWATNNHHANLPQAALRGDIRALVFYDRVLTSSEIDDVHNHFAGDYTSSEMA